jgi:Fe2+ transport system protein FeoA
MTLADLTTGTRAFVIGLSQGFGNDDRLASRGIVPGAQLEIQRSGSTMLVNVEGSRWAMHHTEARGIEVAPC